MTTVRGPGWRARALDPCGERRPTPAARSSARWAGHDGRDDVDDDETSKPRSRRPVRTQVSGRAQLSARTVRGNGGTSGAPPGTACSPG